MDFLEAFNLGEPARAGGLQVFPLYPLRPADVDVALLADAVAHRDATIGEDAHADGPWFRQVIVDNRGDVSVLVRDGDLLLGGMQDRTAERSCVVPARSRVTVPTLCVEQRRSHYAGRQDFAVGRTSADPELRSSRLAASLRGGHVQALTWEMVGARRASRGIADRGGSLREVEERDAAALKAIEEKLPPVHLASGVAIAWTGPQRTQVHVEVFGSAQACAAAWPGLVRAAAQCTRPNARAPKVSRTELRKLFRLAAKASFHDAPRVGSGELKRAQLESGAATVLTVEGRLVHASLFAA